MSTTKPTALSFFFTRAERPSDLSNGRLYSYGIVPGMDSDDYQITLTVSVEDPGQERALADHLVRVLNTAPLAEQAMKLASKKLDSVAFLSEEGDTRAVKLSLRIALASLRGDGEQPEAVTSEFDPERDDHQHADPDQHLDQHHHGATAFLERVQILCRRLR